jgi:hypothetical protein
VTFPSIDSFNRMSVLHEKDALDLIQTAGKAARGV